MIYYKYETNKKKNSSIDKVYILEIFIFFKIGLKNEEILIRHGVSRVLSWIIICLVVKLLKQSCEEHKT